MCKVSVIMPAYNCADFISGAIASILSQTEQNLELIVINDGSTDETLDAASVMGGKDPRVKVFSQPNSGKPSIARNRGLELARGEYVCFLDADDLCSPEKIQVPLGLLEQHPQIDLVFHDVRFMDEAGNEQSYTYLQSVGFRQNVLSKSSRLSNSSFLCNERALFFFMCTKVTTILMSSVLIRRQRLLKEKVFFPEDLKIGEDIDLWFRLVQAGGVAYIDRPLSLYRLYATSVTKSPDRNVYDPVSAHMRNYARAKILLDPLQRRMYRKRIAGDLFNIGYRYSGQRRYVEAFEAYLQSLRWCFAMAPLKGIVKASLLGCLAKSQEIL